MNGHLPFQSMLSCRTCVYTIRHPPPHTNKRLSVIGHLSPSRLNIQILLSMQDGEKNLLANITKKSKSRLIFSYSYLETQTAIRSCNPSPHLLTLLSSALAPLPGKLTRRRVQTAAQSTKLIFLSSQPLP